ncbi:hypothetical protein [uncultured Treponema sp.]|uniref:hypothetical protein n=1 Tax=uncultured Treponema sp. TaxID=162155 RepID=UPI0025DED8BC|nr:hypothetical protein [uncultured Treponema sp.]
MKKLISLFTLLFICSFSVFAGPFGLDMGMTIEDVTKACGGNEPEYISDDRYYIQPVKSHPLFEGYVVWISETEGLYYIKGISREIRTNDYGTEVKQEFAKLLSPLERKYGKFEIVDEIVSDDVLPYKLKQDSWMLTIAEGSRICEAHWSTDEDNFEKFDELITISIGVKTEATYITSKAYIWIEYGFANAIEGFNALDDVL